MTDTKWAEPIKGKAVVYTAKGGPEVVNVRERVVRAPAEGEVRLAVKAAAVNPADIILRELGIRPGMDGQEYPIVPGLEAAGIIEAVGPGVSRLHVGQEVMACVAVTRPEGGAQAQFVVAPAASAVPIPDGVTLAEASTLPMNGLTALRALELADLKPGDWLAVSGGAGLVAHYAIALAKRQNLRVIADARPEEAALVRGYGADIVVDRGPSMVAAIRREIPDGVGAFLDTAVLDNQCFGAILRRGWCCQSNANCSPVGGIRARRPYVQSTGWLAFSRHARTPRHHLVPNAAVCLTVPA